MPYGPMYSAVRCLLGRFFYRGGVVMVNNRGCIIKEVSIVFMDLVMFVL